VLEGDLSEEVFYQALKEQVVQLYGTKGLAETDLRLISYDSDAKVAILRCRHRSLRKIRGTIALLTNVVSQPVALQVVKVSGTIKSLKASDSI
jgi:RNase P/RNase MRP subunit POP5